MDDMKYVESNDCFLEMTTVKWGFMSIKLVIYGNEGCGYPHFHFYKNLKPEGGIPKSCRNGGGCLLMESPNYFAHGNHNETLTPDEIKGLIEFLRMRNKTFPSSTNWDYIIGLWNDNNPECRQLPDYLKIPKYKSDMRTIK